MPFLGKTPSQIVDPEVDIDGGTIDGVSIGSVTANAGAFTNLTATGTLTLPDDGISGDDVNGGTISNFASTGIDDNATSTAITIDGSQNVGIGTTNPTAYSGQTNLNINSGGVSRIDFDISDSLQGYALAESGYLGLIANTSNYLMLGAGNLERMRISSTGDVQVGTAAVTGGRYFDIYNTGSTATDFAITRFITQQVGSSSTTSADIFKRKNGQFGISNNDTHADAYINFTVGATERMRLDASGNLIVGNTSIDAASSVSLKNEGSIRSVHASGAGGDSLFGGISGVSNGYQILIDSSNNQSYKWHNGGTPSMTLDSSGRLGIGLTPSYKLDVDVGAPASQDQLLGRFSSQAGVRSIAFVWDDSQSTLGIGTQTNHSLAFHINGSSAERLRIDTYGGLNIKSVAGTQAATFGGANLVNGITALPSSAGTPFVVGRDTGTLRSAHFAGHLKFNSGYGIDFDVSNLANGTVGSNVLDDYEEGTFTMGMQTSGNNASLSIGNQTAYYTKIGNLVTFYWYSTGVNVTNAGSGYVVLSGFPFTSSSASNLYGLLHTSHTTVANTDGGYIANNSTVGYLVQQHSTSGAGFNTGYPLYIMVQGFYYTA